MADNSIDRTRLPKTGTEDGLATGAMLDLSFLKLGEMLKVRPDLLVVPSALPPFAKVRVQKGEVSFALVISNIWEFQLTHFVLTLHRLSRAC